MKTIHIAVHEGYDVLLGDGLLADAGGRLSTLFTPRAVAVVSDKTVDSLYGARVAASLTAAGFSVRKFVFPPGEHYKTLATFGELLNFLADEKLTKSDIILALGGGIVGDLSGFAASAYLRGTQFVQAPTTLLAMVDASVGGKTGVNLPAGKNLAGAFYQPRLVLADTTALASLPPKYQGDGIAEIIKYGILADAELFAELEAGNLTSHLPKIIARCIEIKRDFVNADEYDAGARQKLNLGHTFGHAIEKASGFTLTHGHAVAVGLAMVSKAAAAKGWCAPEVALRVEAVLKRYALPCACSFPQDELLKAALNDKKRRGEEITLVIPRSIGECSLHKIPVAELREIFSLARKAVN